ncbi:MAG: hypothetical protein MSJ26_05215 [Oscillospiraceae bacterium]|nr:hypothetical protein [Oscillospiraceae bacterium]
MSDKVSFFLTIVIFILSAANCVLNIIGGNYALAVIWGIVAVCNIISTVLRLKNKK